MWNIDPFLITPHEATPADHPAEGPLDHATAEEHWRPAGFDDCSARTDLAPAALTIQHPFDIMDCLARQFPEPAIDRLLDSEMDRQNPPATTREPESGCYRVDNLAG